MATGNHGGRGTFRGPSAWGGSGPGGSGGAPTDGPYVTTAASAGLSNETLIGSIILPPDIFANRPSAAGLVAGTIFWATDTLAVYRADGAGAWVTAQTDVATQTNLTAHTIDTTTVHGLADTVAVPETWVSNGAGGYILKTLIGRIFVGPDDPATASPGGRNVDYDVWIQT